jgi:hypothetical protein
VSAAILAEASELSNVWQVQFLSFSIMAKAMKAMKAMKARKAVDQYFVESKFQIINFKFIGIKMLPDPSSKL